MAGPVAEVAGIRRDAARSHDQENLFLTLLSRVDWLLLGGIAALVAFGLWALAGITRFDDVNDPRYFLVHQATFAAIGVVAALAAIAIGPGRVRHAWPWIYGGTVGALALVLVVGQNVRGATRWVALGSFQVQPSELAKPLLALALAGFLADRGRRLAEPGTLAIAVVLSVVPMALVFVEPDLGTALVYGALLAGAVYVAGVPWTHLTALALAAALLAVSVIWLVPNLTGHDVLKPYQKDRLLYFWKPSKDALGATYNVTESKIAVASGGVNGRGELQATQTKLNFLPAHRNDFAFAAFAEQHGFVSAAALLLLYLLIIWRGLRVITLATDAFSAIVAGGVLCMLLFQIVINVGMTMGIAPVTGIPLPLVSYGGSATIATLAGLGLLLGIQIRSGRRRSW